MFAWPLPRTSAHAPTPIFIDLSFSTGLSKCRLPSSRQLCRCISPDRRERRVASLLKHLQGTRHLPTRERFACVLHAARELLHNASASRCGETVNIFGDRGEEISQFVVLAVASGHLTLFGGDGGGGYPARLPLEFCNCSCRGGRPACGIVSMGMGHRMRPLGGKQPSRQKLEKFFTFASLFPAL